MCIFFHLLRRLVKFFVIGKRVGIGTRDVRVHEGRPFSRPAIFGGGFELAQMLAEANWIRIPILSSAAVAAPAADASVDRLREKFPNLEQSAPVVEETDVSLLPQAPAPCERSRRPLIPATCFQKTGTA